MYKYVLYGTPLDSDIQLFLTPTNTSPFAAFECDKLTFRREYESRVAGDYLHTISLPNTHGRVVSVHTDRPVNRSVAGQSWCLEVTDVVQISWTGGTPELHYDLGPECNQQLLAFWLIHICLPLYLALEQGYDFIHSAAVEVDDNPILFIAPSTGGKSTLGDYFLSRGHPMLSDDKVATFRHNDEFWAVPSHPHHRPWREPEVLGRPVEAFAEHPHPIHAFYLLEKGEAGTSVEITEVAGFRKFESLLPHYLFSFGYLRQQRMRWLAQLADKSKIFRVSRPWGKEHLRESYEAICRHSRSITY